MRSRPKDLQNRPAPDLSANWPNARLLCRFTRVQARRGLVPKWPNPAVVTCTALATRPANGFGGRRAGGPERRKAMETTIVATSSLQELMSRGAGTPKGNGDSAQISPASAERAASRGAGTPKGNGDSKPTIVATSSLQEEPGGRNAERQWRRIRSRRLP